MGDLGQHGIGEILHHQGHTVGLGPAEAQQGSGLCLAGLEGHPGPAKFPPQPHKPPIVGALIHEQRLARRHAVYVNAVVLQVVGEWLLYIKDQAIDSWMLYDQPIQDGVDVAWIGHGAIEVAGQPIHAA